MTDEPDIIDDADDSPKKGRAPKAEGPKVFLDRACFLTADSRCVQLCYIHTTDDMKEVEKSGGYYGTVRQALEGYVDRVLRGQPSKTVLQLTNLLNKVADTIERVLPVVSEAVGKKNVPVPEVEKALLEVDNVAKRKRSKIVIKEKELKLNAEQRGHVLRDVANEFSEKELIPGLKWREVPQILSGAIAEALYDYDPKTVYPEYRKVVHMFVRQYLKTNYGAK